MHHALWICEAVLPCAVLSQPKHIRLQRTLYCVCSPSCCCAACVVQATSTRSRQTGLHKCCGLARTATWGRPAFTTSETHSVLISCMIAADFVPRCRLIYASASEGGSAAFCSICQPHSRSSDPGCSHACASARQCCRSESLNVQGTNTR
jgi:hypothetical protein